MYRIYLILSCISLLSFTAQAQFQKYDWGHGIGSTEYDGSNAITMDSQDNVYKGGSFAGVVDFDGGFGVHQLNALNHRHSFITKEDANGKLKWAYHFEGFSDSFIGELKMLGDTTIIVVGELYAGDSLDVDLNPNQHFNIRKLHAFDEMFVLALDTTGQLRWARSFTTNGLASELEVTSNGDIFILGQFDEVFDGNPDVNQFTRINASASGKSDAFLVKFSADGTLLNTWLWQSPSNMIPYDLECASNGALHITGEFSGTVDFDPGTGTHNIARTGNFTFGFWLKLDPSGNFKFVRTWDNGGYTFISCVKSFPDGSLLFGGYAGANSAQVNLNLSPTNQVINPAFIGPGEDSFLLIKTDSLGNQIWKNDVGNCYPSLNTPNPFWFKVECIPTYNGNFQTLIPYSGRPQIITASGKQYLHSENPDMSLLFLFTDSSGNTYDYTSYDLGTSFLRMHDVCVSPSGSVAITGIFNGSLDLNPGKGIDQTSSTAQNYDLYVAKFNTCQEYYEGEVIKGCTTYTHSDGQVISGDSTFFSLVPSVGSCDSLVRHKFELRPLDSWVRFSNFASDFFYIDEEHWQDEHVVEWYICDTDSLVGTNRTFFPQWDDDYYAIVYESSARVCADTTSCFQNHNISYEVSTIPALSLFPNPASTQVRVEIPKNNSIKALYLFDTSGKMVLQSTETTFSVEQVRDGVYFVRVVLEDGLEHQFKLIVQH